MATRTSGKTSIILVIILAVGALGLAWVYLGAGDEPEPETPKARAADEGGPMTDEERAEYLKQYVSLEGLEIVEDRRADTNAVVPGLRRVRGTIRNSGPRRLHEVHLSVYPKDDVGEVLGSYVEDIVNKGGPLAPGESRDFSFTIPDKKAFAGDFSHRLR